MRHGNCDVCCAEGELIICSSTMGAISNGYCRSCHAEGLEPYFVIVATLFGCPDRAVLHPAVIPQIEASIAKVGKSWDDLWADVRQGEDEFAKALNELAAKEAQDDEDTARALELGGHGDGEEQ